MPQIKQTETTSPKTLTKVGENLTVFSAPSTSRPGWYHYVFVYNDERGIQCTCEGGGTTASVGTSTLCHYVWLNNLLRAKR